MERSLGVGSSGGVGYEQWSMISDTVLGHGETPAADYHMMAESPQGNAVSVSEEERGRASVARLPLPRNVLGESFVAAKWVRVR